MQNAMGAERTARRFLAQNLRAYAAAVSAVFSATFSASFSVAVGSIKKKLASASCAPGPPVS